MKIRPFHDNVFVERDEPEEKKSPAGIVLPKNVENPPDTAVVLAVGPGRFLSDGSKVIPDVRIGDRIFVSRFSGTEVTVGCEKRLVISWGDILGIIEDENDEEVVESINIINEDDSVDSESKVEDKDN